MTALAARLGRIGLGCVTFGREIDEAASRALMDHAFARGVRFFDTAAAYSDGASEKIVGAWLAAHRPESEQVLVATKLQPPFTRAAIAASVAASRARLGLAALPLLFLHRWDATAETAEALRAFDQLVLSGKVQALGISNVTAAQLARLLKMQAQLGLARFQAVQNNHNVAVREVDDALVEICARHGLAIVTYSPLGAGFLTGKHRDGPAAGTRFTLVPGHQPIYFTETAARRFAQLETLAARAGCTPAHLALAWALHQPHTACTLIGGRTPAHLDQAFDALGFDNTEILALLSASQARSPS